MKAKITFSGIDVTNVQFCAVLDDARVVIESKPSALARALVEAGVQPGDALWENWSCQNKFDDLLAATKAGDDTRVKMYEFELWRRMS